ncbi:FAD:protein FMN transferase [Promicromonospora sp. NFX87]|uniref:FAD:protein FMN transferase n=1 Tax=Promicromonospora sp. NFX87 TaxID=3402691 RepID=UPI003AFAD7F7
MRDATRTAPPAAPARLEFEAIGTRWIIDTPAPLPVTTQAEVRREIAAFDATWSRFRTDSFVHDLARRPRRHHVDADGAAMLGLYAALAPATEGAVNPLVGHALEDLGYDAGYTLKPSSSGRGSVPAWPALGWDPATSTVDPSAPVLLDVGAVGKGRLVDLVVGVLEAAGIEQFTVDAGGDIRQVGSRGLRVALEHPGDARRAVGVVRLPAGGGAVCASATNRRVWGDRLHHMLDARTGRPTSDIVATWAVAPTAMLADAAATAAFFLDADAVRELLPVTGLVRMPRRGPLQAGGIDGQVFL